MYLSRLILNPRHRLVRRDLADCREFHRTILSAFPLQNSPTLSESYSLDSSADGLPRPDLAEPAAGDTAGDSAGDTPSRPTRDPVAPPGADPLAAGPSINGSPDARARFGVLHRLDQQPRTGALAVLVQSAVAPDWSRLPAGYLIDTGGDLVNPATQPLEPFWAGLRTGDRLRFRLRANPTRRLSGRRAEATADPTITRWSGKRVEIQAEADQIAWLHRKGEVGGFRLAGRTVTSPDGTDHFLPNVRVIPEAKQFGRPGRPAGPPADEWLPDTMSRPSGRLTFGSAIFEGELIVIEADEFRRTLRQGIGSAKAFGFGLLSIARLPGGNGGR